MMMMIVGNNSSYIHFLRSDEALEHSINLYYIGILNIHIVHTTQAFNTFIKQKNKRKNS